MPKRRDTTTLFQILLTAGDSAVVGASYGLAWVLRFRYGLLGSWLPGADSAGVYIRALPAVLAVFWLIFKYLGLYRRRRGLLSGDELPRLFNGILFSLMALSGLAFFVRGFNFSIKVFLAMGFLSLLGLTAWRVLLRWAQVRARRRGLGVARTVLVGSGPVARKLAERAKSDPGAGYRIVGLVDDGPGARRAARTWGIPYLGSLSSLKAEAERIQATCVIVALGARAHAKTQGILLDFDGSPIELRIVSDLFGLISSPMTFDEIHGIPVFALREAPLDRLGNRVLKRALDLGLTAPGLLLLSPLLALVALAVKLDSPGPVFYDQERVGLNGRVFRILKFRTMRADADRSVTWTVKGDPRRTRVGTFLRRTSLDELPQLFNILRGEMSLVGPRPEQPRYVQEFSRDIPRYMQRHQVRAGLTGWAQVHGWRGDTSIEERTVFDLYYVENWSLSLDLLILFKTAVELFEHETAY